MADRRRCIINGSVLRNESYHGLSICVWEWCTRRGELMPWGKATIEAVKSLRRKVSQWGHWTAIDSPSSMTGESASVVQMLINLMVGVGQ